MKPLRQSAFGLVVLTLSLACSSAPPAGPGLAGPALATEQSLTGSATVRYSPIEGGCWFLAITGQGVYQPVALPPGFRQDGIPVTVTVHGAPNNVGYCSGAPFVVVDSIAGR
jgi:hypothetical protein